MTEGRLNHNDWRWWVPMTEQDWMLIAWLFWDIKFPNENYYFQDGELMSVF